MNKRIIILILAIVLILVVTKAHKQIIPSKFYDEVGNKFVLVDSQGNLRSSDQASITAANKVELAGDLDVKNNANITNNISGKKLSGDGSVPKGTVVAYTTRSQTPTAPVGWAFCTGQTVTDTDGLQFVTPDLRGRFILGSNPMPIGTRNESLSQRAVNTPGGAETHVLSEAEMPKHSHNLMRTDDMTGGQYARNNFSSVLIGDRWQKKYSDVNVDNNFWIEPKGNNSPHNNMPPFLVLAYIVKL